MLREIAGKTVEVRGGWDAYEVLDPTTKTVIISKTTNPECGLYEVDNREVREAIRSYYRAS